MPIQDVAEKTKREIREWSALLSCTTPLFRMDMLWVDGLWSREKERMDAESAVRHGSADDDVGIPRASLNFSARRRREERVVRGRMQKSRRRPLKCWYCGTRHFKIDPICPPARKDPLGWLLETSVVGWYTRKKDAKKEPTLGTRIVFS